MTQSWDSMNTPEKRRLPIGEDPTQSSPRSHSGTRVKNRENSYCSAWEWLRSFISESSKRGVIIPRPLSLSMRLRSEGFHQSDILGGRRAPDRQAKSATGLTYTFSRWFLSLNVKREIHLYWAFTRHFTFIVSFNFLNHHEPFVWFWPPYGWENWISR